MKVRLEDVSQNSSKKFNKVIINDLTLYFSYETVVAFQKEDKPLVVSQNEWGRTTGKHLNWLNDDRRERIPYGDFIKQLEVALKNL